MPKIAKAVMHATGATTYNVLQNNGAAAGQEVPHVHFCIIPKYADSSGLPRHWPERLLDEEEAPQLAAASAARVQ